MASAYSSCLSIVRFSGSSRCPRRCPLIKFGRQARVRRSTPATCYSAIFGGWARSPARASIRLVLRPPILGRLAAFLTSSPASMMTSPKNKRPETEADVQGGWMLPNAGSTPSETRRTAIVTADKHGRMAARGRKQTDGGRGAACLAASAGTVSLEEQNASGQHTRQGACLRRSSGSPQPKRPYAFHIDSIRVPYAENHCVSERYPPN